MHSAFDFVFVFYNGLDKIIVFTCNTDFVTFLAFLNVNKGNNNKIFMYVFM